MTPRPLTVVRAPGAAATALSRLTAILATTNGRRATTLVTNTSFWRRASASRTPTVDLDAVIAQVGEAAAGDLRIRILHRRDDAADAGVGDRDRAGPGAAGVAARLERAVERGAAGARAGGAQRVHLGVGLARPLVEAGPDHDAGVVDDDGADQRVRAGAAAAALGERQRRRHVRLVAPRSVTPSP